MVYMNATTVPYDSSRVSLTAPLALSLAENAFKAGRNVTAARYLDIAYAILDAQFGMAEAEASALPKSG